MIDMSSKSVTTKAEGNYTTGQSWGALKKAWKGYRIAKVQDDQPRLREYATKIQKIQGQLGIAIADFDCLKS